MRRIVTALTFVGLMLAALLLPATANAATAIEYGLAASAVEYAL